MKLSIKQIRIKVISSLSSGWKVFRFLEISKRQGEREGTKKGAVDVIRITMAAGESKDQIFVGRDQDGRRRVVRG